MTRAPTYYELLNVSRSASPDQIRKAYLRLMKCHHPDVASDRSEAVDLPFINQVYEALSEPTKRAAYDAELARQSRPALSAPTTQAFLGDRRPLPAWGIWAALTIAGFVALFASMSLADPRAQPVQRFNQNLSWLQPRGLASPDPRTARLPAFRDIQRQAQLGVTATPDEAVRQSSRCFSVSRERGSRLDAQLCVVFDNAFLYSHSMPHAGLPPYFNEVIVKLRHASALVEFAPAEPLMERLWKATFAALMANLHQSAKALDQADAQSATDLAKLANAAADAAPPGLAPPAPSWDNR